MMKKARPFLLILLILIVIGYLGYRGMNRKKKTEVQPAKTADNSLQANDVSTVAGADQSTNQTDIDFNAQCESGVWIKVADIQGDMANFSGLLRAVDASDETVPQQLRTYKYFLDGKEKIAITGDDASLAGVVDNFVGREVEIQGVLKSGSVKELAAVQIRCSGKETDANAIDLRRKMLDYIAGNIGALAPEKAVYQKWSVDSAVILDEKTFYVDYYDTIEDSDNADPNLDTMHRILLELDTQDGGGFNAKVLAYFVPGEDDLVLKSGIDKYKDVDQNSLPLYTYDAEENSWTRD